MTFPSATPRVVAPAAPQEAPPFRFPVVASIAPLLVALALWAVTRSPYALLFAAFGPVSAIAGYVDSRVGARRIARRETARFAAETAAARAEVDALHDAERAALAETAPGAHQLLARAGADPRRWAADVASSVPVTLGTGDQPSSVVVQGPPHPELLTHAATLAGAPVVVDARWGIGVCGPALLAEAAARAIAVQLAWSLSPARYWVASAEAWAEGLPHPRSTRTRRGSLIEFGVIGADSALVRVAVAARTDELPGECRVVVALDASGGARVLDHPEPHRRAAITMSPVSALEAAHWAGRAAVDARRDGLIDAAELLPTAVPLHTLRPLPGAEGLRCVFAVDSSGPVSVDLVADGPHAVIGGTTGSGKSELLVSWVLSLAEAVPPRRVTFLLVDFKGGAAFAPLAALPHTVGIVTDLDAAAAERALASLRAELRFRERAIAEAGARDIDGAPALARLVIVVDEFAAMLSEHPDLHALFSDIAARGRSLGVHLILCTQRPAGVVRDALLANADLRVSLRVNNRADSSAVIGVDSAAALPPAGRGAGFLAMAGLPSRRVQFALASEADIARVSACWPDAGPPRRPWCPPLPAVVGETEVDAGEVAAGEVAFGMLDLPHEQRRGAATWLPARDGHLLVVGAARSGKSAAIAALRPATIVPPDVPAAWDAIVGLEIARDITVAIDDLDALLARCSPEYRDALVDLLARALREGPARGVHLVLAAQRVTADVQSLAALTQSRLWLRHGSRQELLLAGGDAAHWIADLPAGGGSWQGHRVQVIRSPLRPSSGEAEVLEAPEGPLAIVTPRPGSVAARANAAGLVAVALDDPDARSVADVVVGSVDDWLSQWGSIQAMRRTATILLEGCTPADYRALTRSRELPPPLAGLSSVAWRLRDDGGVDRMRLPF